MADNEPKSYEVEQTKSILDYLRHVTTLSTGSLILLVTFLEKLFAQPKWKPLVIISLIGFGTTIIASLTAQTSVIHDFPNRAGRYSTSNIGKWSMLLTWTGFGGGVVALLIFAVRNLI